MVSVVRMDDLCCRGILKVTGVRVGRSMGLRLMEIGLGHCLVLRVRVELARQRHGVHWLEVWRVAVDKGVPIRVLRIRVG